MEFVNGSQLSPFRPQPLFAAQYVAVHPMKESDGVKNDCARAKKAKPIMYAAARTTNSHGFVKGRVMWMRKGSSERLRARLPVYKVRLRKGVGSTVVWYKIAVPYSGERKERTR